MEKLVVIFATDNGKSYMDRHFGDAEYFDLYEINQGDVHFIKRIKNVISNTEDKHVSEQKAVGIAGLFKNDGVHVLVSKKFGANINKMKTKFVCILMNEQHISDSVKTIQQEYDRIVAEWDNGESRHYLNFKK
ncbi:MAG: NifB/NifX family molybdenum-iron cluster-binding protein [Calditrichaceae bacterium]